MTFDPQVDVTEDEVTEDVVTEDVVTEADTSEVDDVLVLDEAPDPDAVLPVWEPTGNAAVDAALEELHAVAVSELGAHADIYERLQQSLRSTLDGLAADDSA